MSRVLLIVAFFATLGCSSTPTDSGVLEGQVTLDGAAVDDGTITFLPVDGASATSGGFIKQGKFDVKNVPLGKAKVSITAVKVVGSKPVYNTPNSPVMPITVNPIPKKYNEKTELVFDVQPGMNRNDWHLTTR